MPNPSFSRGIIIKLFQMKNAKIKFSVEELKVESFVTSLDAELAQRLAGGIGEASHPTHTQKTDPLHPDECTCPSILQDAGFGGSRF